MADYRMSDTKRADGCYVTFHRVETFDPHADPREYHTMTDIIAGLQAVLDVVSAARGLTFMGNDPDGFPKVGPVGVAQLQDALAVIGPQTRSHTMTTSRTAVDAVEENTRLREINAELLKALKWFVVNPGAFAARAAIAKAEDA